MTVATDFTQKHVAVGCKGFLRIMKLWGVSDDDAAKLLGESAHLTKTPSEMARLITAEQLTRICYVLRVLHNQRALYYPSIKQEDDNLRKPIASPPFCGVSLINLILIDPANSLQLARRWLSDQIVRKQLHVSSHS